MDEKKKAEPSIPAQIESVVRGAVTDFYSAPTAAPDAAAGQSEAAHDPRCAKLEGGGYICVAGCPAFRMGEVPKRDCPADVKSSLHSPVESADSNASLPDWPRKDSLHLSKEILNVTEPVAEAIARDPKAFTELLRGALQHASESNDLHVSIPTWALEKVLSGGWYCMVREISGRDLVLRALRNLRPRVACPLWAAVSDGFGLGSTYSQELCRNFGLDPNEQIGSARADEPDENETPTPSISFGEGKKIYDQGWNDGLDALRKVFLALAARAGRN